MVLIKLIFYEIEQTSHCYCNISIFIALHPIKFMAEPCAVKIIRGLHLHKKITDQFNIYSLL